MPQYLNSNHRPNIIINSQSGNIFTMNRVEKQWLISLICMSINGYENDQPGKLWAKYMNKQFIVNEIKRDFKCEKLFNKWTTKSKYIEVQ